MNNADLSPSVRIFQLVNERIGWTNQRILDDLRRLPVLKDEEYLMSTKAQITGDDWDQISLFLALVRIAVKRKLQEAIPLLLERASYGDPGETMRTLPGQLEAIADGHNSLVRRAAFQMAYSEHRGARLWSVFTLSFHFHDTEVFELLIDKLRDPAILVAAQATTGLAVFCEYRPEFSARALEVLKTAMYERRELRENSWARIEDAIQEIEHWKDYHDTH